LTLVLGILTFFVVLTVLVLVHEAGHFTFAKLFGVRVDEFGLGFPPRVAGRRVRGTLYSLNAIPLGGFVKMRGENGEDTAPDSFGAKPPWQRLVILAAGPIMNVLLAVAVFFVMFSVGYPKGLTTITGVASGSPAQRAGLIAGDRITRVDGRTVADRAALQDAIAARLGHAVTLTVVDSGITRIVRVVPRVHPPNGQGAVGIVMARTVIVHVGPGTALRESVGQVGGMVASVPSLLASIPAHGAQNVSGPIGIANVTTQAVGASRQIGPSPVFSVLAILSTSLGVLNLLPIPALDGGRILFVLVSWIRRRNLDPELEGLIHAAGMAFLLVLIAFISYQDIVRWVSGSF